MTTSFTPGVAALALAIGGPAVAAGARQAPLPSPAAHAPVQSIEFVRVDSEITLRRLIVRSPGSKETILLLHGFPETVLAWQDVASRLAGRYEVHAIDWPGYGLSTRPLATKFGYAPRDYARILRAYIRVAKINRSKLTIYATDIGALPALLVALEDPKIARRIIVGDFAPLDRPEFMAERLQRLKAPETGEQVRIALNQSRDEILENAFKRGLPAPSQPRISSALAADMREGWNSGSMTSADAFYHYYAHFTRDQKFLEANLGRLKAPIEVVWGEQDIYIDTRMAREFAGRTGAKLTILPGIGHYPHHQDPELVVRQLLQED
jgi:pimeloyl-ACP methyl ester carboxylesterase